MAMHHGAARKLQFFNGRDSVFISSVVPFLQHLYVESKDVVYSENEYADEIFFITKGKVNYTFGPDFIVFKSIGRGAYFGDIEVMKQIPRKYATVAAENCNLLTLGKNLLNHVLHDFQGIQ
jgi:CRP-like cAMP-binding protein